MDSVHGGESEPSPRRWVAHDGSYQVDHRCGEQHRELIGAPSAVDHFDQHAHRAVSRRPRVGGNDRPTDRLGASSRAVAAHRRSMYHRPRLGCRHRIPRVHGRGRERRLEGSGAREEAVRLGVWSGARPENTRGVRRFVRFHDAHTDIDGPRRCSVPRRTRSIPATRVLDRPHDRRSSATYSRFEPHRAPGLLERVRTPRKDGDWNTRWRPG